MGYLHELALLALSFLVNFTEACCDQDYSLDALLAAVYHRLLYEALRNDDYGEVDLVGDVLHVLVGLNALNDLVLDVHRINLASLVFLEVLEDLVAEFQGVVGCPDNRYALGSEEVVKTHQPHR